MTWWLPAGFSWNCPNIQIQPNSLEIIQKKEELSPRLVYLLRELLLKVIPCIQFFPTFIFLSLHHCILHIVLFPCSFVDYY